VISHLLQQSNSLFTELDRGNMANAIDQDQFNVGQQMLSLGIVLTEIPANMILYRTGPAFWLTLQLFLFGTVSTFQAFQRGYAPFIVTRFLLGITESGFIPGWVSSFLKHLNTREIIANQSVQWTLDPEHLVSASRVGTPRCIELT
jgi:MFS family permease